MERGWVASPRQVGPVLLSPTIGGYPTNCQGSLVRFGGGILSLALPGVSLVVGEKASQAFEVVSSLPRFFFEGWGGLGFELRASC
jgi:hypothetical protein